MQIPGAGCLSKRMRLTGRNTRYDEQSGAIIVEQSDEIKLLMQVLQRLSRIEERLDALTHESGAESGTAMGDQ